MAPGVVSDVWKGAGGGRLWEKVPGALQLLEREWRAGYVADSVRLCD